jgi:hypothetical protein
MANGHKTGGRKKGSRNKLPAQVKEMVIEALSRAGGVDYLHTQSAENPTAFMTLIGKVIPLQVGGDPDNPVIHEIRRTYVSP